MSFSWKLATAFSCLSVRPTSGRSSRAIFRMLLPSLTPVTIYARMAFIVDLVISTTSSPLRFVAQPTASIPIGSKRSTCLRTRRPITDSPPRTSAASICGLISSMPRSRIASQSAMLRTRAAGVLPRIFERPARSVFVISFSHALTFVFSLRSSSRCMRR